RFLSVCHISTTVYFLFSLLTRRPPCSTHFPYTTLFRSFSIFILPILPTAAKLRGSSHLDGQDGGQRPWVRYPCPWDMLRAHERRSEEHTSELQSPYDLVCRLLLEKKKKKKGIFISSPYF